MENIGIIQKLKNLIQKFGNRFQNMLECNETSKLKELKFAGSSERELRMHMNI